MKKNQEKSELTNKDVGKKAEVSPSGTNRRVSCLPKFLAISVLVLAGIAGAIWFAVMEAQRIPDFYASVLATDMKKAKADGQQFERNLVRLQNTSRRKLPWLIEITQDQVNGWFASDLPEKFPDSLPQEIENPRVVFTQNETKLAFKYNTNGATGIVVISADIFCTDVPNEIAIRINHVRAGLVPLPVGPWLEKVTNGIRNAGIPVFWSKTGDSPLAVFTLPEHITTNSTQHVVVEAIDLRPGKLVIAGKTIRQDVQRKSKKKPDKK